MKEMARYGFILSLICILASASLALVNSVTNKKIIAQAQAEEEAALKSVMPQAVKFEAVKSGSDTIYYKALGSDDKTIGVVFKALGKGYSSTIETMVGMANDGKLTAIKVLSLNETPGLGSQVAESDFTQRFAGISIEGLSQVQAITGATISSKALIDSVKKKAEEIKGIIK